MWCLGSEWGAEDPPALPASVRGWTLWYPFLAGRLFGQPPSSSHGRYTQPLPLPVLWPACSKSGGPGASARPPAGHLWECFQRDEVHGALPHSGEGIKDINKVERKVNLLIVCVDVVQVCVWEKTTKCKFYTFCLKFAIESLHHLHACTRVHHMWHCVRLHLEILISLSSSSCCYVLSLTWWGSTTSDFSAAMLSRRTSSKGKCRWCPFHSNRSCYNLTDPDSAHLSNVWKSFFWSR